MKRMVFLVKQPHATRSDSGATLRVQRSSLQRHGIFLLLFVAVVLLLLQLPSMVAAQQRRVMNGGTVTSNLTITAPQSIIEMNGVTFTGGIAIQIDISGMSSIARPVWVTICNCQFLNGATIYFIGDGGAVDTKKPVYITFEGTKFTDGGLGFTGYFPPLTRIVIAHVTVLINNRLVVLPLWNPFNWGGGDGRYAYWMSFYNFYLRTKSSILFTGCYFGGTRAGGSQLYAHASFPIGLNTNFNLYDRSALWIRNTTTAKVFMLHGHGTISANTLSSVVLENMTMICDRFCLSFEDGSFTLSDRSAFVLSDSSASVPLNEEGEDLFFTRANILFTGSSAFLIKNNILSPYRYAFSVDPGTTFTVSSNSIATWFNNSVAGTPWRMTVTTATGGAALAQCNDLAGVPLRLVDQYITAGLNGLTAASPCTVGLTATCECQCSNIGVGPDCLGTIRPLYVNQCIETASLLPTLTQRITLTERQSATRTVNAATVTHFKGTHSVSSSIAEWRTKTRTERPTVTRDRKREASNTARATPTHTFELTLTQWVTPSKTSSTSSSVSHSQPRTETRSTSREATATPTNRYLLSVSVSTTTHTRPPIQWAPSSTSPMYSPSSRTHSHSLELSPTSHAKRANSTRLSPTLATNADALRKGSLTASPTQMKPRSQTSNSFRAVSLKSSIAKTSQTIQSPSISPSSDLLSCRCPSAHAAAVMPQQNCVLCLTNASSVVVLASNATGVGSSSVSVGSPSVLTTELVPRATLQRRPSLLITLRIEGGSCWAARNVTTLNGRNISQSSATSSPPDANTSLVELLLAPPVDIPWTDDATLYADTTLSLNITLVCGRSAVSSFVLIYVPAPGLPQALTESVTTVASVGLWVSIAGTGIGSGSVARISTSRNLVLCSNGDLSGLFGVPTNCDTNDGTAGNLVAAACGLAVALVLCLIVGATSMKSQRGVASQTPFIDAMKRLAFPSCLLSLLLAILPATAGMSVVQLVGAATNSACDSINGIRVRLGFYAASWWQ